MLSTIFGSRLRARVIGWMMTHSGEWFFVRQLTVILGENSTNLSRELARLARLGILAVRTEGRQKYYRADEQSPIFPELRGLAVKTAGLSDVIRAALTPLAGRIEAAFIHGSFAEGREHSESDVDLVIVGTASLAEVASALHSAQETLGREINPVVYPPEEFARKVREGSHFLARVTSGTKIFLMGTDHDLTRLACQPVAGGA